MENLFHISTYKFVGNVFDSSANFISFIDTVNNKGFLKTSLITGSISFLDYLI
jgi:hypothetical protein